MADFPDDVIEAARVLNMRLHSATELGQRTKWIAEALMKERERSRQLLSEAERREREARVKALEEAAKVAESERMRHSTGSGFDSHPSHTTAFRIREAIRALQSEER